MPPLVLFHTQTFLSSENTTAPAAISSPMVAPIHAYERDGAIPAHGRGMTERQLEEAREGLSRHLTDPPRELTMTDPTEATNMAVNRNGVGRIREDEIGELALKQAIDTLTVARIAAQEPMPTEQPEVAGAGRRQNRVKESRDLIVGIMLRI